MANDLPGHGKKNEKTNKNKQTSRRFGPAAEEWREAAARQRAGKTGFLDDVNFLVTRGRLVRGEAAVAGPVQTGLEDTGEPLGPQELPIETQYDTSL